MTTFNMNSWGDQRAKDDDRRYFICNFGRRFRIRDLFPFEIDGSVERATGITRRVIVVQIAPGVRMRQLVRMVSFDLYGQKIDCEDNDAALAIAFEENASPVRLAEYRAVCAKYGVAPC